MKIAFVRTASNQLTYGSYNIQEIGLAKSIIRYGVSVDIYARFKNIDKSKIIETHNNNEIKIIPLSGIRVYKEIMYYPKLKSDLLNSNYDVVQLLDDSQMMLPSLFKSLKKAGVKTILWQGMYRNFSGKIANLLQKVYDTWAISMINNYADLKIAKTEFAATYLKNKGYSKCYVLPVGLDEINEKIDYNLINEIVEFQKSHPKLLLYVGTFEPRRNIIFILSLLKDLESKGYGLILVGNGPDSEMIQQRIQKDNLSNAILYYRSIPNENLPEIFKISTCFLLPTNYEIYGMVVLESLLNGTPVISTPEAGPLTILKDQIYGKCLPLSKDKWIKEIMYQSNHTVQKVRLKRKVYVTDSFNWEQIGKTYYHNYLHPLLVQ